MPEIILEIESSCDDTSAVVIKDGYLLSNVLASQEVHKSYGGVIRDPETLEHVQVAGLYPCGEGAGYAGGIVSSALDGINCASKI